jgi:hypothetical protein
MTTTRTEVTTVTAQPTPLHTLEQLAVQLAHAQEVAEQANQHVERIKAAIRQHPDVHGPDTYAAGPLTVLVQQNHRFDQRLAEKAIPEHLLPLVTVEKVTRTIDKKKVEVLAPDYLEACTATFEDKVVLR